MLFHELEINSFFEIPGDDGFPNYIKVTQTQALDRDRIAIQEFEPDTEVCLLYRKVWDEVSGRAYHLDFEDITTKKKYFKFHAGGRDDQRKEIES